MATYRVVRFFQDELFVPHVLASGLTLGEAQAHCNHPESSSMTAELRGNVRTTELCGAWFDGYEKEV